MFAGQGAQHPGMGLELYGKSPVAARIFDQADSILGWSVSELCFRGTMEELTACAHCQPAIFVTSMAEYYASREGLDSGDSFVAAGGLSLGELSAVTAAGVVDFETGLRMVARRGELMDECCRRTEGAMAAIIGCDEAVLERVCREHGVHVANYNCPGQRIISGEKSRVVEAAAALAPHSMKTQLLQVAGGFHSPLMQSASDAFGEYLQGIDFQEPGIRLVHNVSGTWTEDSGMSVKELLARQISSPVRWEECVVHLMEESDGLLELGPGKVLSGLARRIRPSRG